MDRLACINIDSFLLQIVTKRHPKKVNMPLVVVESDTPSACILQVNASARKQHVMPGDSYRHAMAVCPDLIAEVVTEWEVSLAHEDILYALHSLAPSLQAQEKTSGIFWVNMVGMLPLFASELVWAEHVTSKLAELSFRCSVVIGCSQFAVTAISYRILGKTIVSEDPQQERETANRVSLGHLNIETSLRNELARLGVHTVGDLVRLPAGDVLIRFGQAAYGLHCLATGEKQGTFCPQRKSNIPRFELAMEDPTSSYQQLCFAAKQLLHRVITWCEGKHVTIAAMDMDFICEDGSRYSQVVRIAEPSVDLPRWLRLIFLRLEVMSLQHKVQEIVFVPQCVRPDKKQLQLFSSEQRQNIDAAIRAANQVIDELRSKLGDDSVVVACMQNRHMPEAQFYWKPLHKIKGVTNVAASSPQALVRTVPTKSFLLPEHSVRDASQIVGPYIIDGGWWQKRVSRLYHYIYRGSAVCEWVYYDTVRHRWFSYGRVS